MEADAMLSTPGAEPFPAPLSPTIELGELLREYQLGLVLIAGATEPKPEMPVQWVHVSELEDPTPFLTPRTVLLTTGARFAAVEDQADADQYVRRLLVAGVTALGFGVGLHWDRVPARFVTACDRLGLPLFRVPYATAFVAIVQTAVRLIDAQVRARDLWAIETQRAVARASLQKDGLAAALLEAAQRLDRWICITDRSGRILEFAPQSARAAAPIEWIRRETRRLIERGASAGRIDTDTGAGLQLQLLGRVNQVLGVLVAEDHGPPDTAERSLLGLVAALATIQLEHRSGIAEAQASLRETIVQLLLDGNFPLVAKIAPGTLTRIPSGSIVVARFAGPAAESNGFVEDLRTLDAASPGLFSSTHEGSPLIIAESRHLISIRRLFITHEVASGISERGSMRGLSELVDQADRALEFALTSDAQAPIDYLPALHSGVLHLLDDHPQARRRAEGLLAPITHHDQRHSDAIELSLATWLGHNGQTSPAAAELGVHRHTLKARVQTAASLLQADLDSPDVRAELWTALRLIGASTA